MTIRSSRSPWRLFVFLGLLSSVRVEAGERAYVETLTEIIVVDLETLAIDARIATGATSSATISTERSRAFIASRQESGAVMLRSVSLDSYQDVARSEGGFGDPLSIAIDPGGESLFVGLDQGTRFALQIVDANTLTVIREVALPGIPRRIVPSGFGQVAVLMFQSCPPADVCRGRDAIARVDVPSGTVLGLIEGRYGGAVYHSAVYSSDGTRLNAGSSAGFFHFDAATGELLSHVGIPCCGGSFRMNPVDGFAYVLQSEFAAGSVTVVSPSKERAVARLNLTDPCFVPSSIDFTNAGNVGVIAGEVCPDCTLDSCRGAFLTVDLETYTPLEMIEVGGGPLYVRVTADDKFAATDGWLKRLLLLDLGAPVSYSVLSLGSFLGSLVIGPGSNPVPTATATPQARKEHGNDGCTMGKPDRAGPLDLLFLLACASMLTAVRTANRANSLPLPGWMRSAFHHDAARR